jgi:TPR repeat protein
LLGGFDEVRRAADLGDAFAQATMAGKTGGEERFRWAEKSAAQGERDGFCYLGHCYQFGIGCGRDVERAKADFLVAVELGLVHAMVRVGSLLDKNDPQRFVWLGRATNGESSYFLEEMGDQIRNFNSGTKNA